MLWVVVANEWKLIESDADVEQGLSGECELFLEYQHCLGLIRAIGPSDGLKKAQEGTRTLEGEDLSLGGPKIRENFDELSKLGLGGGACDPVKKLLGESIDEEDVTCGILRRLSLLLRC